MATELKIGDEGGTNLDGPARIVRYKIIATTGESDWPLAVNLYDDVSLRGVSAARTDGTVKGWVVKLLPPKPKTETIRRWLCMGSVGDRAILTTCRKVTTKDREVDITYTPDGRIVSIVFVDEKPPPLNVRVVSDMGEPRESGEPPKTMGLRVGDVVRLRNGSTDIIQDTDGINENCDQPIIGTRYQWWPDGRYSLIGEESGRDIVAIVSRVDTTPRKVDAETLGIIWERLRKVPGAACYNDLREAVDDVVATLEEAGWGGGR